MLLTEVPLAVIMKDKAIGGADIKISAAAAFLLGSFRGLAALISGLLLAVTVMPAVKRIRKEENDVPFPLVPFLAAGIITVYLL